MKTLRDVGDETRLERNTHPDDSTRTTEPIVFVCALIAFKLGTLQLVNLAFEILNLVLQLFNSVAIVISLCL